MNKSSGGICPPNLIFSLYYKLCKFRGIDPMEVSELKWLVGFIERKSLESKRYATQSLTLSSKNKKYLFNIKKNKA